MPKGPQKKAGGRVRGYRFLEPCLLNQLLRGPAHGYELAAGSQHCGFEGGEVIPSIVYRTLRDLEEQGHVTSEWEMESGRKPRRVYTLALQGEDYLSALIQEVREMDKVLHTLLEVHDSIMQEKAREGAQQEPVTEGRSA
ncbi:PadR family transcriptional regulator [Candidatus Poribacteria bacterium]|jgi:PadR family transcriptional regulator, regulatory protein PadR|nr:PadR family transcriptional regulator [Candidatus Poribacteria bacterium]